MEWLPNTITAIRFLLIVPVGYGLVLEEYVLTLTLFILAGITDALDGYLARRFNWVTHCGALIDPLADKVLLIVVYSIFAQQNIVPLWLLFVVVGRDIAIVSGTLVLYCLTNHFFVGSSLEGKLCTFTQILFAVVLLFDQDILQMPLLVVESLQVLVVMLCLISVLGYACRVIVKLRAHQEIN